MTDLPLLALPLKPPGRAPVGTWGVPDPDYFKKQIQREVVNFGGTPSTPAFVALITKLMVKEAELESAYRDEYYTYDDMTERYPVEDCLVMLFEPEETVTTGSVNHDHTLTPDALETL